MFDKIPADKPGEGTAMENKMIVTVDVVLLTLDLKSELKDGLRVGLMKRPNAPYRGMLALPGGYVHADEDADAKAAAERVLATKIGVQAPYLEQLATFSGPTRDPRGWSVSVCYYALVPPGMMEKWEPAHLVRADKLPALAFDHAELIAAAVARLRSKSSYSALPAYLLPEAFTLAELQRIYERILGTSLDKSSFRRKLRDLDFLEEVPGGFQGGHRRPAQLYRLKEMALFDRTI
jgi:8-oxo-dGTP diphosphatase